jgi:uncharacterized protein with von Willebrand factor type A (vWA) domain
VPLALKLFDTEVRDANIEDLRAGKILGGGGTDFDAPLRDLLSTREIEAAVLFTDGEAHVSLPVARSLRASRKRLYVVHFGERRPGYRSALDALAKNTLVVPTSPHG